MLAGMYRKQLSKADIDDVFAEMEIATGTRAEQIDVAALVDLSTRLYHRVNSCLLYTTDAAGQGFRV